MGAGSIELCVRDMAGNLIFRKAKKIHDKNNLVAEAIAIMEGLKYCVENQFLPIIMEINSLSMN